jgi:hypothetical protein
VFAGASGVYSQDNSNLFWDDASNFLGLGTASPTNYVQLGASSVIGQDINSLYIGSNFKNNGQRITTNYAAQTYWDQTNGAVVFRTAASGAANSAISFTETVRIHASSGVSIGNTTDPGAKALRVSGKIQANTDVGNSGVNIEGIYNNVPTSTTRTCTISGVEYGTAEVTLGGYIPAGGGYFSIKVVVGGFQASTGTYDVTALVNVQSGNAQIGAVTKNASTVTFTIRNNSGTQPLLLSGMISSISAAAVSVTIA